MVKNALANVSIFAHIGGMDHTTVKQIDALPDDIADALIAEVRVFAAKSGQTPQNVLKKAICATWGTWEGWCARTSSPRLERAQRVIAYMRANPPVSDPSQSQKKDVA